MHLVDVMVEAELGCSRSFEKEGEYSDEKLTDPDQAIDFIQRTGVDALTISIGEESESTPQLSIGF